MRVQHVMQESPAGFLNDIATKVGVSTYLPTCCVVPPMDRNRVVDPLLNCSLLWGGGGGISLSGLLCSVRGFLRILCNFFL
jgi:hypothetical protein